MGGRENKRPKKKSIKAKVTSKFSEKRLESRMGKKQKKGMAGPSTEFVTRSHALKKLQVTLKDFRRLCILKGIYPRVPEKTPKNGTGKIFYDIKDLTYLNHEPLLNKFREFKSFMKKIRKSSGRNEIEKARQRDALKPQMTLDHLVKERYPRFVDALRDLDDCLCMIHLFAALPSVGRVTASHTIKCQELTRQWQYYVAKSHCLSKTFVSIKGYYFQATVLGEQITWLVPHKFTQQVPKEVDLRVMVTFLDFYEVFLKFVLYKLFSMENLSYPPTIDKKLNDAGSCLLAVRTEGQSVDAAANNPDMVTVALKGSEGGDADADMDVDETSAAGASKGKAGKGSKQKASAAAVTTMESKLATLGAKLDNMPDFDEYELSEAEKAEKLPVEELSAAFKGFQEEDDHVGEEERTVFSTVESQEKTKRLFSGLRFFCNREVPLDWMQLCIISHGGQVGWDGETTPFAADNDGITHQIVDRPLKADARKDREYIQPQWVFDSVNAQLLLPVKRYLAGEKLPPHLSPFVDDSKEGYLPKYRQEIRTLQAAAGIKVAPTLALSGGEGSADKAAAAAAGEGRGKGKEDHAAEVRKERGGKAYSASKEELDEGEGDEEEDDDEDDEEDDEEESEDEDEEEDEVGDAFEGDSDDDDDDDDSSSDESSDEEDKGDKVDDSAPRRTLEVNQATSKGSKGIEFAEKEDAITEVSRLLTICPALPCPALESDRCF
jgi:pescadillo protein